MRVFLIGYMGSGKSTLGPLLAHELNCSFTDLDAYIEQEYHKPIPDIFKTEGEARFRELEQIYLRQLSERDQAVIAVGGGTPCFDINMELMNKTGVTIYLQSGVSELVSRLTAQSREKRPLISNLSTNELNGFIAAHLLEREPFYLKAKHTLKVVDKSIPELVELMKLLLH
jgi:shikimate kinase